MSFRESFSRSAAALRRFIIRTKRTFGGKIFFTPTSALIRRVVIYGIFLFLVAVIQTSLPIIPIFKYSVPNLTLAAASAIGFFDSERAGAVSGIFAGAVLDALGSVTISVMAGACFAAGYFAGYVAGRLLPRSFYPFLPCLAAVSVFNMLLSVICAFASVPGLRPVLFFGRSLLPELFFTFVFGIPAALLANICVRLAGKTARERTIS